jgi:hypothetical protein
MTKLIYIPALTIRQPWASASLRDVDRKGVECRQKGTSHRGALLIHAGKEYDVEGLDSGEHDVFGIATIDAPRAALIGLVRLIDVVRTHTSKWASPGYKRYWVHVDPIVFHEPIPASGQQYMWTPGEKEMREVWRQLTELRETLPEALWRRYGFEV